MAKEKIYIPVLKIGFPTIWTHGIAVVAYVRKRDFPIFNLDLKYLFEKRGKKFLVYRIIVLILDDYII